MSEVPGPATTPEEVAYRRMMVEKMKAEAKWPFWKKAIVVIGALWGVGALAKLFSGEANHSAKNTAVVVAPSSQSPPAGKAELNKPEAEMTDKELEESFPTDVRGQDARVLGHFKSPEARASHFVPWGQVSRKFMKFTGGSWDEEEVKRLAKWKRTDMDASAAFVLAVDATSNQGVERFGEREIRKSKSRYAGRPIYLHARIAQIEEDGGTMTADVVPDDWRDHLALIGHFSTDFVDGDRVELVGFLTSTPAPGSNDKFATVVVAALLKPGSIMAMNKVLHGFEERPSRRHKDADDE